MLKQMLLQNWLEVTKVVWVLIFLSLMLLAWTVPNSSISLALSVCGMVLSTVIALASTSYNNPES
jgi:hypothetical protein